MHAFFPNDLAHNRKEHVSFQNNDQRHTKPAEAVTSVAVPHPTKRSKGDFTGLDVVLEDETTRLANSLWQQVCLRGPKVSCTMTSSSIESTIPFSPLDFDVPVTSGFLEAVSGRGEHRQHSENNSNTTSPLASPSTFCIEHSSHNKTDEGTITIDRTFSPQKLMDVFTKAPVTENNKTTGQSAMSLSELLSSHQLRHLMGLGTQTQKETFQQYDCYNESNNNTNNNNLFPKCRGYERHRKNILMVESDRSESGNDSFDDEKMECLDTTMLSTDLAVAALSPKNTCSSTTVGDYDESMISTTITTENILNNVTLTTSSNVPFIDKRHHSNQVNETAGITKTQSKTAQRSSFTDHHEIPKLNIKQLVTESNEKKIDTFLNRHANNKNNNTYSHRDYCNNNEDNDIRFLIPGTASTKMNQISGSNNDKCLTCSMNTLPDKQVELLPLTNSRHSPISQRSMHDNKEKYGYNDDNTNALGTTSESVLNKSSKTTTHNNNNNFEELTVTSSSSSLSNNNIVTKRTPRQFSNGTSSVASFVSCRSTLCSNNNAHHQSMDYNNKNYINCNTLIGREPYKKFNSITTHKKEDEERKQPSKKPQQTLHHAETCDLPQPPRPLLSSLSPRNLKIHSARKTAQTMHTKDPATTTATAITNTSYLIPTCSFPTSSRSNQQQNNPSSLETHVTHNSTHTPSSSPTCPSSFSLSQHNNNNNNNPRPALLPSSSRWRYNHCNEEEFLRDFRLLMQKEAEAAATTNNNWNVSSSSRTPSSITKKPLCVPRLCLDTAIKKQQYCCSPTTDLMKQQQQQQQQQENNLTLKNIDTTTIVELNNKLSGNEEEFHTDSSFHEKHFLQHISNNEKFDLYFKEQDDLIQSLKKRCRSASRNETIKHQQQQHEELFYNNKTNNHRCLNGSITHRDGLRMKTLLKDPKSPLSASYPYDNNSMEKVEEEEEKKKKNIEDQLYQCRTSRHLDTIQRYNEMALRHLNRCSYTCNTPKINQQKNSCDNDIMSKCTCKFVDNRKQYDLGLLLSSSNIVAHHNPVPIVQTERDATKRFSDNNNKFHTYDKLLDKTDQEQTKITNRIKSSHCNVKKPSQEIITPQPQSSTTSPSFHLRNCSNNKFILSETTSIRKTPMIDSFSSSPSSSSSFSSSSSSSSSCNNNDDDYLNSSKISASKIKRTTTIKQQQNTKTLHDEYEHQNSYISSFCNNPEYTTMSEKTKKYNNNNITPLALNNKQNVSNIVSSRQKKKIQVNDENHPSNNNNHHHHSISDRKMFHEDTSESYNHRRNLLLSTQQCSSRKKTNSINNDEKNSVSATTATAIPQTDQHYFCLDEKQQKNKKSNNNNITTHKLDCVPGTCNNNLLCRESMMTSRQNNTKFLNRQDQSITTTPRQYKSHNTTTDTYYHHEPLSSSRAHLKTSTIDFSFSSLITKKQQKPHHLLSTTHHHPIITATTPSSSSKSTEADTAINAVENKPTPGRKIFSVIDLGHKKEQKTLTSPRGSHNNNNRSLIEYNLKKKRATKKDGVLIMSLPATTYHQQQCNNNTTTNQHFLKRPVPQTARFAPRESPMTSLCNKNRLLTPRFPGWGW